MQKASAAVIGEHWLSSNFREITNPQLFPASGGGN